MSFPLDIRTELNIGGTWSDISPDVYLRAVKAISRGLRDQGSAADPASLSLTLNNRGGKYSPRNAMSALFGLIGRNTPIRVSLPSDGDHYLQLDGRAGNYASTPDSSALDITGDLDVRAEIAPDWYGSSSQIVIGKWDRASLQQSWMLQIIDGNIWFRHSIGGGDAYVDGWNYGRPLPSLPERAAIRVTLDVDNGNGGRTVTFYWSDSLDGEWTQIGNPITPTGVTALYSGSAPLQIGITDLRNGIDDPRYPLNGRGYRFEVRNGIGGPVVASPDFRAVPAGSSTLTDSAGLVWALSGAAEVRDREDRFVGEVSSWPLKWSTDDADIWTPVSASGLLRRLGQGAKALDSTLRRRIPSGNPIAYWPMEEQADATRAYSPIAGVLPASVSSVEWASWDTLPSSAPLPMMTGASTLSATVPAFTPGEWQVEFVYNADDKVPLEDVQLVKFTSTNGTVRRWEFLMKNSRASVHGYNAANALVVDKHIAIGADVFHGWTRFRFWAADDDTGGTFTWRINWQDVGGEAGGYTGTGTGTCGSIQIISADWPALTEGWGVGHLAVLRTAGDTLYDGSDDAFRGETAVERMRRLAVEEGLSFTRTAGRLDVAPVGFQRQDSLVSLFEAAADADGGMLTEDMRRIGLHYRDRSSLYTQAPAFTLSYTEPGLGPDLEPVDDDAAIVNDVTVTRDGGSAGRAVLADGPLSVQPAPDGIGKYDAAYTLSLSEDEQAEPLAYWKLHLGTFDGARYPTVSLMLHKPGAEWLIPLVQQLREGDKIRITDLPEWVSHDDVDLIVLGWAESLDMYRWELTLNCAPAGPWDTAITDTVKADTDGSVLGLAATATATSVNVRTIAGPQWTDAPEFLPYDIRASGEVMRVTAVKQAALDTFTRTVSSGWGVATSGQTWTNAGGAAADFYVQNNDEGVHSHATRNVSRLTHIPAPSPDVVVQASAATSVLATGGAHYAGVLARYQSVSGDRYLARLTFQTGQTLTLTIIRQVSGVAATLATVTVPGTHAAWRFFNIKFSVIGSTLSAKAWQTGTTEPANWQLTVLDTALTAAGSIGVRTVIDASNTNTLPVYVVHDDFAELTTQTFTVARSQNGVVKSQPAKTAVSIAHLPTTSL
ncbi:hypothetical protein OG548_08205 [Streptomyces sp. NBC_01356]|uniref:hypothetical protein n=1 Tax=Streptomyces sp. NBC_01356 TaxID=2903836 RepID=UPI002E34C2E0|nr:hypothetical protein [Streptomyces sp. NBC_01356]